MRNLRLFPIIVAALVIFISLGNNTSGAEPLRTAFTYTGMLQVNNNPANGQYDFNFGLFDADLEGVQLGNDVNVFVVNVINGFFKVELDFGYPIFTGQATWLDIAIRPSNETLDQQQDDVQDCNGGLDQWQSFTPAISGFLTKVEIYGNSPLLGRSSPGTLQIYEGEGTGGVLLATESVIWTEGDTWKSFTFSRPALLASANKYSLRITVPNIEQCFLAFNDPNLYPGGTLNGDPNLDLSFHTYIASDQSEYTPLSPREEIITVPNAQYALLAETVQIPLRLEGNVPAPDAVIMGFNTGTGGGVYGKNNGSNNSGYLGHASYGVYGIGSTAGYFQGNARVTGNLVVDGSVGVGTPTPQTQLNITKTLTIAANSAYQAPATGKNLELRYRTDAGKDTAEIISIDRGPGSVRKKLWLEGDPIALMFGNVGVGTETPTQELEVIGTIKGDRFNGVPWSSPKFLTSGTLGSLGYLNTGIYKYMVPFDTTIQGVIISADYRANGNSFDINLYVNNALRTRSVASSIADYASVMQALETPINVSAGDVIFITCGQGNGMAQLVVFLYGRYNETTPLD